MGQSERASPGGTSSAAYWNWLYRVAGLVP